MTWLRRMLGSLLSSGNRIILGDVDVDIHPPLLPKKKTPKMSDCPGSETVHASNPRAAFLAVGMRARMRRKCHIPRFRPMVGLVSVLQPRRPAWQRCDGVFFQQPKKHKTVCPPKIYRGCAMRWSFVYRYRWPMVEKFRGGVSSLLFFCGNALVFWSVTVALAAAPSGLGRLEVREIRDKDRKLDSGASRLVSAIEERARRREVRETES